VAALALAAPRGAKDDAFAESVAPVSSVFADDLELSLPLGGVQRLTPEVFRLMTPRDVIELYEVRRGSSRRIRSAWCCCHDSTFGIVCTSLLDTSSSPVRAFVLCACPARHDPFYVVLCAGSGLGPGPLQQRVGTYSFCTSSSSDLGRR